MIAEQHPATKQILSVPMTSLSDKEREISAKLGREIYFEEDFIKIYKILLKDKNTNNFFREYLSACNQFFEEDDV